MSDCTRGGHVCPGSIAGNYIQPQRGIKGVFAYSQNCLNSSLGDAQFDFYYTTDFTNESKSDQL